MLLMLLACAEPQAEGPRLSLDIDPVPLGVHLIEPVGSPYHFDLQITNLGDEPLDLQPASIRGDARCHLEITGPDLEQVVPGESAFLRGWYEPLRAGEDQMALRLPSSDPTQPDLEVAVCALAISEAVEAPRPTASCPRRTPRTAGTSPWSAASGRRTATATSSPPGSPPWLSAKSWASSSWPSRTSWSWRP